MLKITPNESVKPKYLKLFFDFGINLDNRESAIKNVVSVEELKKLEVPLPSIEIQEEIVEQCEEETIYIKMTEKMIEKQKEKIDLRLKEIWIENKDKLKDEPVGSKMFFDSMISKASKPTVE